MYIPGDFAVHSQEQIADFVEQAGAADFVTFGGHGRLLGHLALANPQWRGARADVPGLAIVHGPQAYVSPGWYASTQDHGRVVPTWNYTSVHFTGPVTFHQDGGWLREIV